MPDNECHPFYVTSDVTFEATSAVTGKRFVAPTGNRESGPGLSTTSEGGNYRFAHAGAGSAIAGVSAYDVASGDKGASLGQPGKIVPVTADGTITAGQTVIVGSVGLAKAGSVGVVGLALSGAAAGADAEIKLY